VPVAAVVRFLTLLSEKKPATDTCRFATLASSVAEAGTITRESRAAVPGSGLASVTSIGAKAAPAPLRGVRMA
jgi:hypothetical protein